MTCHRCKNGWHFSDECFVAGACTRVKMVLAKAVFEPLFGWLR